MGDDMITANDTTNYCPYAQDKRDCDGDWDTYCDKISKCQYQHNVRDCDGDLVILCRK